MPLIQEPSKIDIFIDRGGTFTDCIGIPEDGIDIVIKLLSVDPTSYPDAPTEGIRRILEIFTKQEIPRNEKLDTSRIGMIRMGTTVATNALLERKGEKSALLITKGFRDLLDIGYQARPKLFDLAISKPDVLYSDIVEVEERVTIEDSAKDPFPYPIDVSSDPALRTSRSKDVVRILTPLNVEKTKASLEGLYSKGYRTVSVCFAHSYTYPEHEDIARQIAEDVGFTHISLSSILMPMIKLVSRGMSATADAYLTPEIKRYFEGFRAGFKDNLESTRVEFMQSDGGLVNIKSFSGLRAILSGPAGGVVGYANTSYQEDDKIPVIGFDMGGTSTDVSRFGGELEHVFETTTAGVTIQSPQLDINTVAAGGGSILFWKNGLFVVGPESAGAHPGPACYRKGGPLTVTDANLFLGRLLPEYFPSIFGPNEDQPLDYEITKSKFTELAKEINDDIDGNLSPEEVAHGFLGVANESMCRPIRGLTEGRGYDTSAHRLAVFGGAGGQHACSIAAKLGIDTVIVHKYSSILSAYGMALANVIQEAQEPSSLVLQESCMAEINERFDSLTKQVKTNLAQQGIDVSNMETQLYLNLRYSGTDSQIMVQRPPNGNFKGTFEEKHQRDFTFLLPNREIVIDDIRVRGIGKGREIPAKNNLFKELEALSKSPIKFQGAATHCYFGEGGWQTTRILQLSDLQPGDLVAGPSIMIDKTQTIVIVPGSTATIMPDHVIISIKNQKKKPLEDDFNASHEGDKLGESNQDGTSGQTELLQNKPDPVKLTTFGHRFMSIAEQMGRTLQKTAVSINIKERLDFSCAIFGPDGGLVANAPHVPVHLGSMQYAVKYQHELHRKNLSPGDVLVSNHPIAGGTHLPDITVITPIFDKNGTIIFYTASRGHHRDIGGYQGISGNATATELWQEGASIVSFKLVCKGYFNEEGITKILVDEPAQFPDCVGSNSLRDNLSDLKAQIAANAKGANLIHELFDEYGGPVVQFYMSHIQKNAELAVRKYLRTIHSKTHGRSLHAIDTLDNGTRIHITIRTRADGSADFDFTNTDPETLGNGNAPPSVCLSAIIYCLRSLINDDIPLNQGCLAPITVINPQGSILNPSNTAAVYAGNTQTSQRVVDTILKAFQACAASQGCMNSIGFFGGRAAIPGKGYTFAYGETICGGAGAGPTWNGADAVHTHMTNTRISDIEILEKRYPILIREFSLRNASGGSGLYSGGRGVVRVIECREPLTFSMISERRVTTPYGMNGGEDGMPGKNLINISDPASGSGVRRIVNVGPRCVLKLKAGDQFIINSPGGGGWGRKLEEEKKKDDITAGDSVVSGNGIGKKTPPQYPRATGSVHTYQAVQDAN
ncbi:MAG: hypothetical protein M1834_007057 [Cirrosporium novae-zelandiae]|nr:MAG: hypothetical protein M1834_007057 [Cirrosporium novae-zelandiae]